MKPRSPRRSTVTATGAAGLALFLAISGVVSPAVAATTTAWAGWAPLTGSTGDFATTLTFGTAPGLTADVTSTSRSGQVGVISGASTWLSEGTPVGEKYGSSRDLPYLNLRPFADSARVPSVTTYTFDSATPSSGWTFALGDIDADMLQVSAVTAAGAAATATELGFRSGFNYCAPGTTGKPSCTGDALDVPAWDATTQTLTGNADASDTSGSAAWFEPNVPLASLTFTFTARSGFPVYQTWFASLARDIGGEVVTSDGIPEVGATLELFDTNGQSVATTTTDGTGAYSFPGYTAADGYTVELLVPAGKAVVGDSRIPANISEVDVVDADFIVRELGGAPVSGQVLDTAGNPIAGVVITLTDQDGVVTDVSTDATGNYAFESVDAGDYTVTTAVPAGYVLRESPDPITIPANSEVPVTGLDFALAELSSLSGVVTIGGEPAPGLLVTVEGPDGTSSFTTDADGQYSLRDLGPGVYTVTAPAPDGSYPLGESVLEIEITADGTVITDADFDLALEGSISGVVLESAGTPVVGASVEIAGPNGSATVTTNADGAYGFDELRSGDYLLTVTVPDGYSAASPVSQRVTITSGGEIVIDADFELALDVPVTPTDPATPTAPVTPTDPVTPAPSANVPPSGPLASTGVEISPLWGAGGVASLLFGTLVLWASKRRKAIR